MSVAVHMPHVRNPFVLQIGVHALADADEAILVGARELEQL